MAFLLSGGLELGIAFGYVVECEFELEHKYVDIVGVLVFGGVTTLTLRFFTFAKAVRARVGGVFGLFDEENTFGFRFFALAMAAAGAQAGGVFQFFEKALTSSFRFFALFVVAAGARTCGVFFTFDEALA